MPAMPHGPAKPTGSADPLQQLLDTEAQLEAHLAAARDEAERLIDDARAAALQADARCDALIAERSDALRRAREGALQDEIAAIEAAAGDTVRRLDALTGERIADLATLVLARMLGSDADPGEAS